MFSVHNNIIITWTSRRANISTFSAGRTWLTYVSINRTSPAARTVQNKIISTYVVSVDTHIKIIITSPAARLVNNYFVVSVDTHIKIIITSPAARCVNKISTFSAGRTTSNNFNVVSVDTHISNFCSYTAIIIIALTRTSAAANKFDISSLCTYLTYVIIIIKTWTSVDSKKYIELNVCRVQNKIITACYVTYNKSQ